MNHCNHPIQSKLIILLLGSCTLFKTCLSWSSSGGGGGLCRRKSFVCSYGVGLCSYHNQFRREWSPLFQSSMRLNMSDMNNEQGEKKDEEMNDDSEDIEDDDVGSKFNTEEGMETALDWGSAYGSLRRRVGDIKDGKSGSPSYALFSMMTRDSPNEAIASFVNDASPEVINAMSGAVSALLGGLSNPSLGMQTIVKATGDKLSALCLQLQMTGYMFRNAEYVMALRDIMKIENNSIEDYKRAFDRIDQDKSGFIEASEIEDLLLDVYGEDPPAFEVINFIGFFDQNNDGRISWKEFERGLGAMGSERAADAVARNMLALPGSAVENYEDDEDETTSSLEQHISGIVEVELEDGSTVEIEAKDYMDGLKAEALVLKKLLMQEKGLPLPSQANEIESLNLTGNSGGSLSAFIASLGEKNVKTLTEGISPAVIDAMKLLVNYVLDAGPTGEGKVSGDKELELPGSALQQLALWQLVLGYRLREAEATGEYQKMLE